MNVYDKMKMKRCLVYACLNSFECFESILPWCGPFESITCWLEQKQLTIRKRRQEGEKCTVFRPLNENKKRVSLLIVLKQILLQYRFMS